MLCPTASCASHFGACHHSISHLSQRSQKPKLSVRVCWEQQQTQLQPVLPPLHSWSARLLDSSEIRLPCSWYFLALLIQWNGTWCTGEYIDLETGTSCLNSGNGSCGDCWLLSYPVSTLFFRLIKWECYSYNNPYSPQEAVEGSVNEQISLSYPIAVENKLWDTTSRKIHEVFWSFWIFK